MWTFYYRNSILTITENRLPLLDEIIYLLNKLLKNEKLLLLTTINNFNITPHRKWKTVVLFAHKVGQHIKMILSFIYLFFFFFISVMFDL